MRCVSGSLKNVNNGYIIFLHSVRSMNRTDAAGAFARNTGQYRQKEEEQCPLFSVNDHSRNDQDKPNEKRSSHGLAQKQNPQGNRDDWLKRVKGCAIGSAVGSQRPIPKEMAQRRADQADVEDRQDQGRGHVQSLAGDPVVCVSSREGEYGCNSHTDSGNLKGRVLFGQLLDVDRDVGPQDNREHAAENAKRSGGLLGRTDDDGRTQNGQNQGQDILFPDLLSQDQNRKHGNEHRAGGVNQRGKGTGGKRNTQHRCSIGKEIPVKADKEEVLDIFRPDPFEGAKTQGNQDDGR